MNQRRFHRLASIARGLVLVAAVATGAAAAAEVTVFAAASLKESLDRQVQRFTASGGGQVRVSYAGSNALAKQIEAGAPADLFISADGEWMDYLDQRKQIVPGTRRDVLANDLVLIAPVASRATLALEQGGDVAAALLAALGQDGRLALANPDAVPAGKYARAALTTLGAWAAVQPRLARSDNVRAALAFVARGEAPLGIVYRTDAMAEPKVRVVAAFPPASHPPIVYPIAIVAGHDNAATRALYEALIRPEAAAVWREFGFRPLP